MRTQYSRVMNKESGLKISAKKVLCPRCKGHNRIKSDGDGLCTMCNGYGMLWRGIKDTSWYRAIQDDMYNSFRM